MDKVPFSLTHRTSTQRAFVVLKTHQTGTSRRFFAVVTRISPEGLRLAFDECPPVELKNLFRWNRRVKIQLELPPPHRTVATDATLAAIVTSYEWDEAPLSMDFEFPALSEEEAASLRDSNPLLLA